MEHDMKRKGLFGPIPAAIVAVLFLTACLAQSAWAQKKRVYRWVDEEGNVHYSETLPPNWEGETHDELGHDGVVKDEDVSHEPPPVKKVVNPDAEKPELPRDKSGLKRPTPMYTDAEKQQRMDRLLMLRYKSEDEMIEEMEIEVNQLQYDERLLTATRTSLETSLKASIQLAGHRQRAGLEVQQDTLSSIKRIRARLKENQQSLQGLKRREEDTRAQFNQNIERYRELVEMYSEEDS
jgi:hypothetical protein